MKKLSLITILLLIFLSNISQARADNVFDPNNIISDGELLDYKAMNLDDIKKLLTDKGSFLANYTAPNSDGVIKTAAEIIYDAATNNYDCDGLLMSDTPTLAEKQAKCKSVRLNPKFVIVFLQKEQGLIEDKAPSQSRLDWAAGYGCPDGGGCNPRWKGFGKQVNSAVLQFYDYMVNPQYYTYKSGGTYVFNNPYSATYRGPITVTPTNQATAALYNYTPHVYNGNYNFWKIWQRYFSRAYLDGSLLQARSGTDVWLLQNGKKRLLISRNVLISRFDPKRIIMVNASDLDKYPVGDPIKFAQYSLVRTPDQKIYFLIDEQKRGFANKEAFRRIGFNPEEIMDVSVADIANYADLPPFTATSTYATGALLQDTKTGGIFWVINNTKAPIVDRIFLKTKFKDKQIVKAKKGELDKYTKVAPVLFDDGSLLKSPSSLGVYVIANGKKHVITSGTVFEALGYQWSNILTISPQLLSKYEDGDAISNINNVSDDILNVSFTDFSATSTTDQLIYTTGTNATSTNPY